MYKWIGGGSYLICLKQTMAAYSKITDCILESVAASDRIYCFPQSEGLVEDTENHFESKGGFFVAFMVSYV